MNVNEYDSIRIKAKFIMKYIKNYRKSVSEGLMVDLSLLRT